MTDHHKKHSDKHDHAHGSNPKRGGQNRWFVVAVVLMLIGMVIYVVTDNEEIDPGADQPNQQVPADAPAE